MIVALLNANLIILYENVSADPGAIVSKILALNPNQSPTGENNQGQQVELKAYANARATIVQALHSEPILVRTGKYPEDFAAGWLEEIAGLLLSIAVSLGELFWNDVLKGMMGVNNALNGNGKKS